MKDIPDTRVCKVLIYEPYIFKIYGNTRYLLSLFDHVRKDRFELLLATPLENEFLEHVTKRGGRYVITPAPQRLKRYGGSIPGDGLFGKLLTAAAILRHTFTLVQLIRKERVDVIQCHSIRSLLTAGLAACLTRRPCFWYIKGVLSNKILDRIGYALADRILYQCETAKNRYYPEWNKKYARKIELLKNGIDLEEIELSASRARAEPPAGIELDKTKLNIVFIGSLNYEKGLDYLVEAFGILRKERPESVLYMIGDSTLAAHGDYGERLAKDIERRGLKDSIVFTGWRADAQAILALMDIFVLPSLGEGVPKSVMEAMALGKPVVATTVGGIPELVRPGETGFLVEPHDARGIARALIELAKDEEKRRAFGRRGREVALEEFSIKKNVAGLERIYQELANLAPDGAS